MKKGTFHEHKCKRCEMVFDSRYRAGRTEYCSSVCRSAAWRERLKNGVESVPKRSGGGVQNRVCDECGKGDEIVMVEMTMRSGIGGEVHSEDVYEVPGCKRCKRIIVFDKVPALSLD